MGKMRRVMLIVAVAIAAIILLATIICNSGYVQNRLISMATDALEKELIIGRTVLWFDYQQVDTTQPTFFQSDMSTHQRQ